MEVSELMHRMCQCLAEMVCMGLLSRPKWNSLSALLGLLKCIALHYIFAYASISFCSESHKTQNQ